MAGVVAVAGTSCAALIGLVLEKPSVTVRGKTLSIYWIAPLLGALVLLVSGMLSPKECLEGLTRESDVNPIKILVLFLSMTLISVFLDNAGFFRYLASAVLRRAKTSQVSLFFLLYAMVSVLTVFTSNDIIVLTFTPFICYFAKNAKIDPVPFLFCEFVAANTWSMVLIIGNPTNIYLAGSAGVSFSEYIPVMLLPTLLSGLVSLGILYLIFRKSLAKKISVAECNEKPKDKVLVALALLHLALCIALLCVSSYAEIPMWLIAFCFCVSLFLSASIYLLVQREKPAILIDTLKRAPLDVIPFVLSMFILVLAFEKYGVTAKVAQILMNWNPIASFGIASFLSANIINNIPMSVLFSAITESVPAAAKSAALFASVIGSNLGAFLTPMGALAGIMWMGMLKNFKVGLSFRRFMKYGAAVSVPALAAALLGLAVAL